MSTSPNLARIRENQRRSRARRKEYLQELEGRWRKCEQVGAEASSEIQQAARRVAEENKKLRAMLREKGVDDADITAYLAHTDEVSDPRRESQALETLLQSRKDCGKGCDEAKTCAGAAGAAGAAAPSPAVTWQSATWSGTEVQTPPDVATGAPVAATSDGPGPSPCVLALEDAISRPVVDPIQIPLPAMGVGPMYIAPPGCQLDIPEYSPVFYGSAPDVSHVSHLTSPMSVSMPTGLVPGLAYNLPVEQDVSGQCCPPGMDCKLEPVPMFGLPFTNHSVS